MKNLYDFSEWTDISEHLRIGEILLEAGKINLIHIGMALDIQRFEKIPLGEIFVNMKVITTGDLNAALTIQSEIDKMLN